MNARAASLARPQLFIKVKLLLAVACVGISNLPPAILDPTAELPSVRTSGLYLYALGQAIPDLVPLIEGSKYVLESCVSLQCIQCHLVDIALKIKATFEGQIGTLN